MRIFNLGISFAFYFISFAYCNPVVTLPVENSTTLVSTPDLSPLIYHVPGSRCTLYILPQDYILPVDEFEYSIWRARVYIADKIASLKGRADTPLPPGQDPFIYGADTPVEISWQSYHGTKMTWGMLAAVMRGLYDCLVKNNHLPYVAVWHVFVAGYEGEVGWGTIRPGRGRGPDAVS